MKRSIEFIKQFLLVTFVAAGLSACPAHVPVAATDQLQAAYRVRDDVILAKTALNDLYTQEMARRKSGQTGTKELISDSTYNEAYKTANAAEVIADQAIAAARTGATTAPALMAKARTKTAEVNKAAGVPVK